MLNIGAKRSYFSADWLGIPAYLFIIALFVIPVTQLVALGFVDDNGSFTTSNLIRSLRNPYISVLTNTFFLAVYTATVAVIGGYMLALWLSRLGEATRGRILIVVIIPLWTSFLVRAFSWIVLLGRNGAINSWLEGTGLTEGPIPLIYNKFGVLVGMSHALMPLAVVTMLSVMLKIDKRLPGAAATLGATPVVSFLSVIFPLSLSGVAAAALLTFILGMGFFIVPALLGSGRETAIAQVIIDQVSTLLDWGFAGAISAVLLLLTLIVVLTFDHLMGGPLLGSRGARPVRLGQSLASVALWLQQFSSRWSSPDSPRSPLSRNWPSSLGVIALLVIAFLALPSLFLIPVSFTNANYLSWPPVGATFRWYTKVLSDQAWRDAFIRSIVVASCSSALAVILGLGTSMAVVWGRWRIRRLVYYMALAPMIVPHIILAVGLFYLFSRAGLTGTILGLVLGHAVISIPYVVIVVTAVLQAHDVRLDQAAWSLGASKWQAFVHVLLPLIGPSLLAAFLFAFVNSFDELTLSLFLTSGGFTTVPKLLWDNAILQVSPVIATVSVIILLIVVLLLMLASMLGRRAAYRRTTA